MTIKFVGCDSVLFFSRSVSCWLLVTIPNLSRKIPARLFAALVLSLPPPPPFILFLAGVTTSDLPKVILTHELFSVAFLAFTWAACYQIQPSQARLEKMVDVQGGM